MRFVIAPDSYKGSLTAVQVADIIAEGLLEVFPQAEVLKCLLQMGRRYGRCFYVLWVEKAHQSDRPFGGEGQGFFWHFA